MPCGQKYTLDTVHNAAGMQNGMRNPRDPQSFRAIHSRQKKNEGKKTIFFSL